MPMTFHPLRIVARDLAAEDAICLTLEIPESLRAEYEFEPGQHLPVRATLGGRELRRTYSIVNQPGEGTLKLGIRVQGAGGLSHFLANEAKIGDSIEALGPTGRFLKARATGAGRHYVAFAAGSGITPVLSILTAALEREPDSHCVLVYGNRTIARTMFLEDIFALKNRFLGRFAACFVMSREPQDAELFNGRLDAARVRQLAGVAFDPASTDEFFVCGPGDMVTAVRDALRELEPEARVHFERFASAAAATAAATAATKAPAATDDQATVTVIQDGRRRSFLMGSGDASVLDAAERAGFDLPFSCRSGVCSTCRAKVVGGEARMEHNVALEDWELAAGFVLCCQARPVGRTLEISYDEK